ncbi:MAG: prolyl oligopeptidase family serine peptidase [Deltaproteobacteria bacterium]|nr:prolyl oligopeptidase family serine peptidase [Deltaproteobacteria bacterium]
MGSETERSKTRVKGFSDAEMDFQLIRQLGSTAYGGASVGECLALVGRVEDGSPSSWVDGFTALARRQEADAERRAERCHSISAREQYLKACNSYRAAEYYTHYRDSTHRDLGMSSRRCFVAAMRHADHTCESRTLPFKDMALPFYFMAPAADGGKRPTLLIVSGFDGTTEEEYLQTGFAALQRGYNIALFAGPGQMDTLRFYPDTGFEPEFEKPVGTVLDYVAGRSDVDPERIALLGISFGGYFATRAASRESRIRALIANSPILDLHDYMTGFIGFDPAEMSDGDDFGPQDLPSIPDDVMSPQLKAMAANLMGRFRQPSFKATYRYMREFTVGEALADIACPCFAMVGAGEGSEPHRQFTSFCDGVSGPVSSYRFTQEEGADSHCQVGNLAFANAVFLDWLDELFD